MKFPSYGASASKRRAREAKKAAYRAQRKRMLLPEKPREERRWCRCERSAAKGALESEVGSLAVSRYSIAVLPVTQSISISVEAPRVQV